jgi:hypothetical protein
MKNLIRIVAAMILMIGAGLVHGDWTNRWGASPALKELASRLDTLPMVLGDWTAEAHELPAAERAMTGAVGAISRIYKNPRNGLALSVLLLTGLPGNISTHTPDVCYPAAGYTLGAPEPYSRSYGKSQSAQFLTASAVKSGVNSSTLRIYWAWHSSKGWSAPEDARWAFAAEPMLSKLYLVRETVGAPVDPKTDPCNEFMKLLLPELDRLMAEPAKAADASAPKG